MTPAAQVERAQQRASGFSLVELLVSLLLTGLLTSAVITLYLNTKRHYLFEDQSARIQENGRYAIALLSRELAMAGFFGSVLSRDAVPGQSIVADCSNNDWALGSANSLDYVNDHTGGSAPLTTAEVQLDCLEPTQLQPSTDLLVVKRTAAQPSVSKGALAGNLTRSAVESWFLLTTAGGDPTWRQVSTQALFTERPHDPAHTYWKASAKVLFVRSFAVSHSDSIPALCAELLAGDGMTTRCYVEGVEDMQLEFGIDTNGDGAVDIYLSDPTAEQLTHSMTVRLHLLLRSVLPLPGYTDTSTYRLGEKVVAPREDAYMRQVFSTVVRLRNIPVNNLQGGV